MFCAGSFWGRWCVSRVRRPRRGVGVCRETASLFQCYPWPFTIDTRRLVRFGWGLAVMLQCVASLEGKRFSLFRFGRLRTVHPVFVQNDDVGLRL